MTLLTSASLLIASATGAASAQPAVQPEPAAPAAVPANPQLFAGATVYGPQNTLVGTVTGVSQGIVTVNTGTHEAPLPATAFGAGSMGPTLPVTREQLGLLVDQQRAAAVARRDAALVAGTAIVSADGQALGTVESVAGDRVVVLRPDSRSRLILPRALLLPHAAGLRTRIGLAELERGATSSGAVTAY
ncbi:hypothetical protein EYB45_09800 [Erythrobacteraceae bacterium CFH 75059]|uniref:hypothetical protein n=1 Tax=Qipengyuania thermophila TaxID=2509361 RepID=UPI00101EC0FA|nr:hypothetical protein [Qipengyuania thermophila]TCD02262.1 hypothetical protein EYB45_09800 [Erythrobacteraceae bacterium CFH 75059]